MNLLSMILVTMLCIGFASCGSDNDDNEDPNNGQPVNPDTKVNDPEGTISLSMRNSNNGKTKLDGIYIDNENFRGAYFASVGEVKGLGDITSIPMTGWADQGKSPFIPFLRRQKYPFIPFLALSCMHGPVCALIYVLRFAYS